MIRTGARRVRLGLWVALATACAVAGCAKKKPDTVTTTAAQPEEDFTNLAAGFRSHTVAPQETLYRLAVIYYGDGSKWQKIYYANRKRIADPADLPVGIRLIIPPRDGEAPEPAPSP